MRVTSFEISKKLTEIGFKAETDYVCDKDGAGGAIGDIIKNPGEEFWSYGLETILQAFHKNIHFDGSNFHYDYRNSEGIFFTEFTTQEESESLADTAARLLILLHEKGIVKFNN
jgi:hypothetical protein